MGQPAWHTQHCASDPLQTGSMGSSETPCILQSSHVCHQSPLTFHTLSHTQYIQTTLNKYSVHALEFWLF